jgi:quercetin dioxygenase-like cupin family protein
MEKEEGFMPDNSFTFVPELLKELAAPENGMTSRVLHKDEQFIITVFGFAAGHELKTHSVPIPALVYVLDGEGEFDLGDQTVRIKSGSLIRMERLLPHALRAKTPFRMLLIQVKDRLKT